jgi:hypothetical protein
MYDPTYPVLFDEVPAVMTLLEIEMFVTVLVTVLADVVGQVTTLTFP